MTMSYEWQQLVKGNGTETGVPSSNTHIYYLMCAYCSITHTFTQTQTSQAKRPTSYRYSQYTQISNTLAKPLLSPENNVQETLRQWLVV